MKKLVIVVVTVLAAAVLATGATADSPLYQDSEFACGVIDADGSGLVTSNSSITWYASGKVVLTCSAYGTNDTGQVVKFNYENTGFLCGLLGFGATDEWNNRVGRNGHIQLTCTGHVNPGDVTGDAAGGAGIG